VGASVTWREGGFTEISRGEGVGRRSNEASARTNWSVRNEKSMTATKNPRAKREEVAIKRKYS